MEWMVVLVSLVEAVVNVIVERYRSKHLYSEAYPNPFRQLHQMFFPLKIGSLVVLLYYCESSCYLVTFVVVDGVMFDNDLIVWILLLLRRRLHHSTMMFLLHRHCPLRRLPLSVTTVDDESHDMVTLYFRSYVDWSNYYHHRRRSVYDTDSHCFVFQKSAVLVMECWRTMEAVEY